MDDVSDDNIRNLTADGKSFVAYRLSLLDSVIDRLIENGTRGTQTEE
jgi:hypothetical protein